MATVSQHPFYSTNTTNLTEIIYIIEDEIVNQNINIAVIIVDHRFHIINYIGYNNLIVLQNHIVVEIGDNLFFIDIVIDANHIHKVFNILVFVFLEFVLI